MIATNAKTPVCGVAQAVFDPEAQTRREACGSLGNGILCAIRQFFVPLLALSFQPAVVADVIHVPDDWPTIQAAIHASFDGDRIIVAPGTYNETVNFFGKAVTLRSAAGAGVTVIDGTGLKDSVVKCINGEGPDTKLDGFTVTRGTGNTSIFGFPVGGGMLNVGSSPTVRHCMFTGNFAVNPEGLARGGGMYNVAGSSPTVAKCAFVENTATAGGGMYNLEDSNPVVVGCSFVENTAGGAAGMANSFSSPTVANCVFVRNVATVGLTGGGGMWNMMESNSVITNCRFIGNSAGIGGGMWNVQAVPVITNCVFAGNHSMSSGGGMQSFESYEEVANCTFKSNSAAFPDGGGISVADGEPLLTNCILWNNIDDAGGSSGGPFMDESAQIAFSNGTPIVRHSVLQNLIIGGTFDNGTNIWSDPLFTDPAGADTIPGTEDDDLRLQQKSPCIDSGDNAAFPEDLVTDLDGKPRFVDDPMRPDTGAGGCPIVDMGPYEFQKGLTHCCPADLDADGVVGVPDLIILLGAWGTNPDHPADFDGDGTVSVPDLIILLGAWGSCS